MEVPRVKLVVQTTSTDDSNEVAGEHAESNIIGVEDSSLGH